MDFKDGVTAIGVIIAGWQFVKKLNVDTSIARYRETIAFIEKREDSMRKQWNGIKNGAFSGAALDEELTVFINQLELVSLLLAKKAFEDELVYSYWWRFFDEPLQVKDVNTWVMLHQHRDVAIFQHYLRRCELWSERIDIEQGLTEPRPWWCRFAPYRRVMEAAGSTASCEHPAV